MSHANLKNILYSLNTMDDFLTSIPAGDLEVIEGDGLNSDDESCLYAPSDLKNVLNMFRDHEPIRMGISGSM